MDSNDTQNQENTTKRRRKTKKNNASKEKVPRRGMGIFQLERLRLQERWKKMTDFNQLQSLKLNTTNSFAPHFPIFHDYFSNGVVPMQYHGAPSYFGGAQSSSISTMTGLDKYSSFPQNGAAGQKGADQSNVDLLSIQNLTYDSDRCDFCSKKKNTNEGLDGEREKFLKVSQDVEVIAVHRKSNFSGGVFMEYEFFPEKKLEIGTCSKNLLADAGCVTDQSGGEASPSSPISAITHNNSLSPTTSVDLSLKL